MPVRGLPRPGRTTTRLLLIALALAVAAWWFRGSSFVQVEQVEITGLTVGDTAALADELRTAAEQMTTLDFSEAELEEIARAHPAVVDLDVEVDFPHAMTIEVLERVPVAFVRSGEDLIAVGGDGVLMPGLEPAQLDVPELPVAASPSGEALTGRDLAQAIALGEAPPELLPFVSKSIIDSERGGLVVILEGGIELRFGDAFDAKAKWDAAAAILADPKLDELAYIDLRLPQRPSVGGAPHGAQIPEDPEPLAPIAPTATDPALAPPAVGPPATVP